MSYFVCTPCNCCTLWFEIAMEENNWPQSREILDCWKIKYFKTILIAYSVVFFTANKGKV